MNKLQYQIAHISTNTTTVISTGAVNVHTIAIPKATTGTVTLQNAAGTSLIVLPVASIGTLILDAIYPAGLSIVTSASDIVAVTYTTP